VTNDYLFCIVPFVGSNMVQSFFTRTMDYVQSTDNSFRFDVHENDRTKPENACDIYSGGARFESQPAAPIVLIYICVCVSHSL
jgi:hypothetical protein